MPPPTTPAIAAALLRLRDSGTTIAAIADQPTIVKLHYVVAEAQPAPGIAPSTDQVASTAQEAILAACNGLERLTSTGLSNDFDEAGAARCILGLEPGTRSLLLKDRRPLAAARMNDMLVESFLHRRRGTPTHEERILQRVAEAMYGRENEFLRLTLREAAADVMLPDSELLASYLSRYERYYEIYTRLHELQANLQSVLDLRVTGDDPVNRRDDYLGVSLFDYSRFLVLLSDFIRNYGGIWLFPDVDVEQGVADSIKLIEHFSGLPYRTESFLRVTYRQHRELDPFLDVIASHGKGRSALAFWTRRLEECRCDLERPSPTTCKVHALLRACRYYTDAIDANWYRQAPWYPAPPTYRRIVDPATLYRDVGLHLDDPPPP